MTLEEKIEQEKLQIEENREKLAYAVTLDNQHLFDTCMQNIEEHEQLAGWLEELKAIKEMDLSIPHHFTKEQSDWIKAYCIKRNIEFYNKAIDDFTEKMVIIMPGHRQDIERIAQQLKAGERYAGSD